MPIISRTSNRILPANSRSADVARATLDAVIPVQNRRTDAAFQVDGYQGVLYRYLESGLPCACQAKGKAIHTRLDKEGKAPPEVINDMLSSSGAFGVRPYAQRSARTPGYNEQRNNGIPSVLEIDMSGYNPAPVPLASLFDEDDIQGANRHTEGLLDRVDTSGYSTSNNLEIEHNEDTDVNGLLSDFDTSLLGHSDVSCPVCFGSGFVGGYSIMQGFRKVFNFQDPTIVLPAVALIAVEKEVPTITTTSVSWRVTLPESCIGIDAFRLWNDFTQVFGFQVRVDGVLLNAEVDLFNNCDGHEHTISLQFNVESTFTHLELQVNQSTLSANFALTHAAKSSTQSLRDATESFSIHLSPRVPTIKPNDVIVESTYQKALQVKTVNGINDHRFTTMGWTVEVRPTQPQELFSMLPRRRPLEHQNVRRMVIANPYTT